MLFLTNPVKKKMSISQTQIQLPLIFIICAYDLASI